MPKQVNVPVVNKVTKGDFLNYVTNCKKGNFVLSEARLYEAFVDALHTTGGYFQIYMSTQPVLSIHVFGRGDILKEHEDFIFEKISQTVQRYHEITCNKDNGEK